LRNQLVSVCKPSAINEWNNAHRYGEDTQSYGDFLEAQITFLKAADKFEVVSTRTDINGKFKFAKLNPGDYAIYAEFSTKSSTVCWLVPIKIEEGKPLKLDLSNSNAKVIRND
jgi:hypothetical protein